MATVENTFEKAIRALKNRNFAEAERKLKTILARQPNHVAALNFLTVALMSMERFDEAEIFVVKAIDLFQDSDASHYNYGLILKRLGKLDHALEQFNRALGLNTNVAETWNNRGTVFNDMGRYQEAVADFDQALSLQGTYSEAFSNKGKSLFRLKKFSEAIVAYDRALEIKPGLAEAWLGRAGVCMELKRFSEALAAYDKVLSLDFDSVDAWLGRGNALAELKRCNDALQAFRKALALKSDSVEAWLGSGYAFVELKRFDEALAAYDEALALRPDLPGPWLGRCVAFGAMRRFDDALAANDQALALEPDSAKAWIHRGYVFTELRRFNEALGAYDKALTLEPDSPEAWQGRGNLLVRGKLYVEAADAYKKLLEIDPHYPFAKGTLLLLKMLVCDWSETDILIEEIGEDISKGLPSAEPFGWQGISTSPKSLHSCAAIYNRGKFGDDVGPPTSPTAGNHQKIRIGYVSGEFRDHATSHLLAGVFENHDSSRFDIYAFDNGWDDHSEMRRRISRGIANMTDIRRLGDHAAAEAVRRNEIDILVNLNGYFGEERTRIFAMRPAPIQVNYLGFPGTLGARYMDYIVADHTVIPTKDQQFYTEKLVYLPNCYQANDNKKVISPLTFGRSDLGLPENGIVFCCFNNSYKILPTMFDSWMRILRQTDDSVLWLLEDATDATSNLRKEAVARGVSAQRLVFANRLPLADHLSRHRLADLFLDTLPYNAHTTASDALWASLPVLTQVGETFAGRVSASLLKAVGLNELAVHSRDEYEKMAIELAADPIRLATIKNKLQNNRLLFPLFDTPLFTRHIEASYEAMYRRYRSGLPPEHIDLTASITT
jgi:protein O-GlcNAc transferase